MKKPGLPKNPTSKKALFLASGAVLVFAAAVAAFFWFTRDEGDTGYIFDKNYAAIKFSDVAKARGMLTDPSAGGAPTPVTAVSPLTGVNLHQFFTQDFAANPFTLKFFRYITSLFGNSPDKATALARAREYIFSQLPPDEAAKVFALYQKYLDCEIALMDEQKKWKQPKTADEIVAFLHKVQEFRREQMGAEAADALYGPDVKTEEYRVRRGSIVGDPNLYGAQKEERIKALTADMWGDEAQAVEESAVDFNRYQEKLAMYKKDMAEMATDADRAAMDHKFREQIFTPDQVKALDGVDAQLASEKKTEDSFKAARAQVEQDASLTPEQKAQRVKDLGTQMLGKEGAEELQRREAIEKGRADMEKAHQK